MSTIRLLIDGDIPPWISVAGGKNIIKNLSGYMQFGDGTLVHRAMAERALGRKLKCKEEVHHVNGDRTDNRPENLVVCPDHSYHSLLHARQKIFDRGGVPGTDKICFQCDRLLPVGAFVNNKRMYDGKHQNCRECVSAFKKSKGYNTGKFDWRARLNQQYRRLHKNPEKAAITWL